MVKYNSETINVRDLERVLDILPDESTIFINKLYQLAWLPENSDNPGGVIEFKRECVNPHGVLTLHINGGGKLLIHGPDDKISYIDETAPTMT